MTVLDRAPCHCRDGQAIASLSRRRRSVRSGFTLLEVIVVLAVLALTAALIAPSFAPPPNRAGSLERVIDAGRRVAIARAQTLSLSLGQGGAWSLRPLPPDDSLELANGRLDAPLSRDFRLRLTPLGACLAEELPPELGAWDAARCDAQAIARRAP